MRGQVFSRVAAVVVALSITAAISFPAQSQAAGPSYHFLSNGDTASVSWWAPDGSNGWISVQRYDSVTTGSSSWLNYQISGPGVFETFSGAIPTSVLTGDWGHGLSLSVDTSAGCPATPYPTCWQNGAGGVISLSWERTNLNRYTNSGRSEYTYTTPWGETITFRSIGTSHGSSAAVTGTVFGVAPAGTNVWGTMGRNHNVSFTYIQEP